MQPIRFSLDGTWDVEIRFIHRQAQSQPIPIDADEVFAWVEMVSGVTRQEIRGKSRQQPIVDARFLVVLGLRQLGMESIAIARVMNHPRNTVNAQLRLAEQYLQTDVQFGKKWGKLRAMILAATSSASCPTCETGPCQPQGTPSQPTPGQASSR